MKHLDRKDTPAVGGGVATTPEVPEQPALPTIPWEQDYPGEPVVGMTDPDNIEIAR